MVAGLVGEGLSRAGLYMHTCMHAYTMRCAPCMHAHTCIGEGLSRAFVSGGLESPTICGQGVKVWPFCPSSGETLGLANSMGLYLQKTNIIRDYLEDYADNRAYWPQEVWRKFARCALAPRRLTHVHIYICMYMAVCAPAPRRLDAPSSLA